MCGDTWDQAAATVACRQLGFAGFVSYNTFIEGPEREDAMTITGFRCHGDEMRLDDCNDARWEVLGECSTNNIVLYCDATGISSVRIPMIMKELVIFNWSSRKSLL